MTTCKQIFDLSTSDGEGLINKMAAGSNYILTGSSDGTDGNIYKLDIDTKQETILCNIGGKVKDIFIYNNEYAIAGCSHGQVVKVLIDQSGQCNILHHYEKVYRGGVLMNG